MKLSWLKGWQRSLSTLQMTSTKTSTGRLKPKPRKRKRGSGRIIPVKMAAPNPTTEKKMTTENKTTAMTSKAAPSPRRNPADKPTEDLANKEASYRKPLPPIQPAH